MSAHKCPVQKEEKKEEEEKKKVEVILAMSVQQLRASFKA